MASNPELSGASHALAQFVEGTDLPTLTVDGEFRIRRLNGKLQAALALDQDVLGAPLEVVAGQFFEEAVVLREIAGAIRTRAWGQRQVQSKKGRWFLMRAFPLDEAGCATSGSMVTFADINGATTLEARFQLAMAAGRLVWWDWDFATGVIAVYGQAQCILGYALDTLPRTQQSWLDHTHPDDLAAVTAATQACADGTSPEWSVVHRFRAADGSWRWVHNSGRLAEPDESGKPTRMLGVTRDIHEAHEAALALKRDAAILAQLWDAVIITDQAYRILSVNDAYERIFGWAKAEAVGQHALFRLQDSARSEGQRILDRVLGGERVDVEWEDYRRDGSRVWIHWRAQPIFDEHGLLSGTVNVGRDISEQKAAAERQRQLQQQLFHAQKMDTLGTLAGGIAHDLNNILAVIFGFNELASLRADESAESRHYHEQIVKAGVRGRDLVKRILTFSRFEEPQRCAVRIAEVIADAAKFIRATLPATVEVVAEVPDNLPPVLADPHQLCQVLLNLATNAAHAMDHRGRLSLRVRTAEFPRARPMATGVLGAGCYYVIEVEDTGHGIPPEVVPRIFDPFFTTKKEGEGTGLGLSVVRAIIDGHGGQVDVHSEPGKGARFSVHLPRTPTVTASPSEPPRSKPVARGDGQTVAVIDDDDLIAASTTAGLQRLGYQTLSFESAQKFWAVFSVAPSGIDAIVTDQTMPGMTGLELVRRLREDGHDLPILLVTGFSAQVRPEIAREFPRLSLLRKPYDHYELANALHGLLAVK